MATKLLDLARMTVASAPGVGPVTLSIAAPGFLTLDQAGAIDGRTYRYGIRDGNAREVSQGVYTAATKTLTRTVLKSTNNDAPINATIAAIVSGVVSAADIHGYTYSDTAPLSPVPGDLWYDSTLGRLAIWTDDGTSQQWVGISPGSGGGASAPAAAIGFKANKNGVDQGPIAGNLTVKVTATNELYDVGGFYDAPNSRWTPPAGKVLITAVVQGVGMDTGAALYAVGFKNGVDVYSSGGGWPGSSASFPVPLVFPDNANGTDYYELSTYLFSASANQKIVGAVNRTFFSGTWLGP